MELGFDYHIRLNEMFLKRIFGASESLCSYDAYQFKSQSQSEVFTLDCEKAFEMGARLTGKTAQ